MKIKIEDEQEGFNSFTKASENIIQNDFDMTSKEIYSSIPRTSYMRSKSNVNTDVHHNKEVHNEKFPGVIRGHIGR